jgi:hypothetical protein
MSRKTPLTLAVTASLAWMAAGASEPDGMPQACVSIDDPLERLACYDEAFGRGQAAASPDPGEADAAPRAPGSAEEFGLSEAQLRARHPGRPSEVRVENVEGTVTSLAHRSTGERVVTLDNGQVWLLTEPTVRGPLREGDTVIIRRAALGSFQLVTPGRVALRARRIE